VKSVAERFGVKMKNGFDKLTTKIIFAILILVMALTFTAGGEVLSTAQKTWYTVRTVDTAAAADANDASLAVTGRKWASRPADPCVLKTSAIDNAVILRFRFSVADANANYEVWQYCTDEDAEMVAAGFAQAGTQTATKGGYYADTITVTSSRWLKAWQSTDATGNNEMAKLWGDSCGGYIYYVRIYSISTGTVSLDRRSF